jgi:hypothetical protein
MSMRSFPTITLLSATFVIGACTPPPVQPQTTAIVTETSAADLSNVVLQSGTAVLIPGTDQIVQFIRVIEDSRCARGVTCIWAGEVKVLLISGSRGTQAREDHEVVVGGSFTTGGYSVTLTQVEPEPVADQKIAPNDYRVALKLAKAR